MSIPSDLPRWTPRPTWHRVWTARDVAAALGVTRQAVWQWTVAGKIPAFKTPGGGQWRYQRAAIEAMMAKLGAREVGRRAVTVAAGAAVGTPAAPLPVPVPGRRSR